LKFAIELQAVYLRGTTYLRSPLFGMIPVVTLFVKGAGAVHAHQLNSHLPGELRLARCPLIFLLHFLRYCSFSKDRPNLFISIQLYLPRTSSWFSSFHFHRCATFNGVNYTGVMSNYADCYFRVYFSSVKKWIARCDKNG